MLIKTTNMKLLLSILFILIFVSNTLILQAETEAESGPNTFKELIEKVSEEGHKIVPASNKTCDAHAKKQIKDHFGLGLSDRDNWIEEQFVKFGDELEALDKKSQAAGKGPLFDKSWFRSVEDKIFSAFGNSRDYDNFVKQLTNNGKDKLKDPQGTRNLYNKLKKLQNDLRSMATQPYVSVNGCAGANQAVVSTQRLSYPIIQWIGYIRFTFKCYCKTNDPKEIKEMEYVVQFSARSNMTSKDFTKTENGKKVTYKRIVPEYQDPRNIKVFLYSVKCCKAKTDDEDASYTDPTETEEISVPGTAGDFLIDSYVDDLLAGNVFIDVNETDKDEAPHQHISAGVGLGYSKSDEEVGFCAGVGYHRQVTDCERSSLYVGGDAMLDLTHQNLNSFNSTTTAFMLGPKAELHVPIKPDVVSFTTGIAGGFGYGVRSSNGQKDNFTLGYLDVLVGLYIYCKCLAFGFEAPIFQYQRTKFRNNYGGYIESDVGLILNKSNPVKASVLIPFGGK